MQMHIYHTKREKEHLEIDSCSDLCDKVIINGAISFSEHPNANTRTFLACLFLKEDLYDIIEPGPQVESLKISLDKITPP